MFKKYLFILFVVSLFFFACNKNSDLTIEEKGNIAFLEKKYQKAIQFWTLAYNRENNKKYLLVKKGRAYLKLGETDFALENFKKASGFLAEDMNIKKNLVRIYLLKEDFRSALTILNSFPASLKDYEIDLLYGDFFLLSGKFQKAEQKYREAVINSTGQTRTYIKLALCLEYMGHSQNAAKYVEKINKQGVLTAEDLILLSDYLIMKKQYSKAEQHIKEAILIDDKNRRFKIHLVELYMKTDEIAKAIEYLEFIAVGYNNDIKIKLILADLYISSMQLEKAEKILFKIESRTVKSRSDYNMIMGKYWMYMGKTPYASSFFNFAAQSHPGLVEAHYYKGLSYLSGGQYKLAEKSFTYTMALDSSHIGAVLGMVIINYQNKNYEIALDYLKKAMNIDSLESSIYMLKGLCLYRSGKYKNAAEEFLRHFCLEGDFSSKYYLMLCHEQLGMESLADKNFGLLLAGNKFDSVFYHNYFSLLFEKGDLNRARLVVDLLLKNNKSDFSIYLSALLNLKSGNLKEAGELFVELKDNKIYSEASFLNMAEINEKKGDLTGVENLLNECIRKNSLESACRLKLGDFYIRHGRTSEAIDLFNEAAVKKTEDPYIYNNLCWLMLKNGKDVTAALDYGRRAYELAPEDPGICDTLGFAYLKRGSYSQSRWMFEKALNLAPKQEISRYHLGLLFYKQGLFVNALEMFDKAGKGNLSAEELENIDKVKQELNKGRGRVSSSGENPDDFFDEKNLTFPEDLIKEKDSFSLDWNSELE